MNHLLQISVLVFSFSTFILPQIPNAGFENWTAGEPDGWISSNFPALVTNVTQSSESHSGSSAVKLEVGNLLTAPYWAHIFTGTDNVYNAGFPVSQRHAELKGYYKLAPSAGKVLEITLAFQKAGEIIGGSVLLFGGSVPNYAQFTIPANYTSSEIPDTCIINIVYLDTADNWTIGGGAWIDDLSLVGLVGIKEISNSQLPNSYNLMQNYPNPFNPSTKIEYSIPKESFVNLKVYNLIGQEVATLVNQYQKTGKYRAEFNAEGLNSGIYIAKLTANGFTRSIKMTLMK